MEKPINSLIRKLEKDEELINNYIANSTDQYPYYKWKVLARRELEVWALIDKAVPKAEFEFVCELKGFEKSLVNYLKETLTHIGLGELL